MASHTPARVDLEALKAGYTDLGGWRRPEQLPLVYTPMYNISFGGLEKLHPFDSQKFRKIVQMLHDSGLVKSGQLVEPVEVTSEQLADVHTAEYLRDLHTSPKRVAQVIALPAVGFVPNFLVQNRVRNNAISLLSLGGQITKPYRRHVGGTMLAAGLAMEFGWAINIGGGMHHAYSNGGSGWCAYDDLMLALRWLRKASGGAVRRAMIVDLDVHQGNGHERDKLLFKDDDLYIVDIYGCELSPGDTAAKAAINIDIGIPCGTQDAEYLAAVDGALDQAFRQFVTPDILLYNAGTDILFGDPRGKMRVSAQAVAERDQKVWAAAAAVSAPIMMVLSGGYAKRNFQVVGDSIINLLRTFQLIGSDGSAQRLRPQQLPAEG